MKKLLSTIMLLATLITFTACSDDEAREDEPTLPSQSVIETPTLINGHEYVDLGLSVKWATVNLGANSPDDYGGYYAWGEVDEKGIYTQNTYEHYKSGSYVNIGTNICGTRYDAAHSKWGAPWRMPTSAEFGELEKSCKKDVMVLNGVVGCRYTAKNGKSIFLPMAGWKMAATSDKGVDFAFWCGTKDNIRAYADLFSHKGTLLGIRSDGLSIRPVAD